MKTLEKKNPIETHNEIRQNHLKIKVFEMKRCYKNMITLEKKKIH